jgi:hypothetical protein
MHEQPDRPRPVEAGGDGDEPVSPTREAMAERLCNQLVRHPAVESVHVRDGDGHVLGAAPENGPDVDAAWTAFVVARAGSLGDGDLRGWGERVSNGRVEGLVVSGPLGETLVIRHGRRYVWLSLLAGVLADGVEPAARQALQQYPQF